MKLLQKNYDDFEIDESLDKANKTFMCKLR